MVPVTISDLKYSTRLLVKRPWFTLLTVVVLAGGLGISLYTFAALNTMLYGSLPLPDGGSIIKIGSGDWMDFRPLDAFELAELRARSERLAELGAYRTSRALVGEPGASRSLRSVNSDWNIFEFTRTRPLHGRGFVSDDHSAVGEPVAVLSYETWQDIFSGDPAAVGELVRVDGRLTRVVGVMPEGYGFPLNAELWLLLGLEEVAPIGYSNMALETYGRLRPGFSAEAAETELTALLQQVRQQRPPANDDRSPSSVDVRAFKDQGAFGVMVVGGLNLLSLSILMLAAVNVGNLLLARTNERIKEVGVRLAFGAPRLRLIVQTTLENVILCSLGGLLALFLAARALEAMNGFMRASFTEAPFWWTWGLDGDVVAAAGLFLLLTVIVVSVLPALCVMNVDPIALVRDGTGEGRSTGRISRGLVTIQVALISAVMVVGSAVAVIANRLGTFEYGMNTDALLTMRFELPVQIYETAQKQLLFYEGLLAELRGTPGISAAAVMQEIGVTRFNVEGREYANADDRPRASRYILSESPSPVGPILIQGRAFDRSDNATGLRTAIVSDSLARTYWPNESAIGRSIEVGDGVIERRTIVGVVGDVNSDPLGMSGVGPAAIYIPMPQLTFRGTRIVVRFVGDESQARSGLYAVLGRLDSTIAPDIRSYSDSLKRVTLFGTTLTRIFVGCGAFAILFAITGIYALSSNAVILKSHEIGLRRALGASAGNVIAFFIAQGTRQLAVGLAFSALLCAVVLFAIGQGFSVGSWSLGLIALTVVLGVSASVLGSIYLSVRGVIRLEPSAALRSG